MFCRTQNTLRYFLKLKIFKNKIIGRCFQRQYQSPAQDMILGVSRNQTAFHSPNTSIITTAARILFMQGVGVNILNSLQGWWSSDYSEILLLNFT
jgi:hypothetical protein